MIRVLYIFLLCFYILPAEAESKNDWLYLTYDIGVSDLDDENALGKYWKTGPTMSLGLRLTAPHRSFRHIISLKNSVEFQYHSFNEAAELGRKYGSDRSEVKLVGEGLWVQSYKIEIVLCAFVDSSSSPYLTFGGGWFKIYNNDIGTEPDIGANFTRRWSMQYSGLWSIGLFGNFTSRTYYNINLSLVLADVNNDIYEDYYSRRMEHHYSTLTIGIEYRLF